MKIFFDTNVLLDYLLYRKPFAEEAEKLFLASIANEYQLLFSALSVADLHYTLKKSSGLARANESIDLILEHFTITATDAKIIRSAHTAKWKDFEDAIQYFSAAEAKADLIVTRDVNGYEERKVKVLSPHEAFLYWIFHRKLLMHPNLFMRSGVSNIEDVPLLPGSY